MMAFFSCFMGEDKGIYYIYKLFWIDFQNQKLLKTWTLLLLAAQAIALEDQYGAA